MSGDQGSYLDLAHRTAHTRNGTTIEVYIPAEAPFEECEALTDAIADIVFNSEGPSGERTPSPTRTGWDALVSGHRNRPDWLDSQ